MNLWKRKKYNLLIQHEPHVDRICIYKKFTVFTEMVILGIKMHNSGWLLLILLLIIFGNNLEMISRIILYCFVLPKPIFIKNRIYWIQRKDITARSCPSQACSSEPIRNADGEYAIKWLFSAIFSLNWPTCRYLSWLCVVRNFRMLSSKVSAG